MSDIKQIVGQQIKEARRSKGLSQKELGEKLGVSFQTINKYETGQNLTIETLQKIAKVLALTVTNLLNGL